MNNIKESLMKTFYGSMREDNAFNAGQILDREVISKWKSALKELENDGLLEIYKQSIIDKQTLRVLVAQGKITNKGLRLIKELGIKDK